MNSQDTTTMSFILGQLKTCLWDFLALFGSVWVFLSLYDKCIADISYTNSDLSIFYSATGAGDVTLFTRLLLYSLLLIALLILVYDLLLPLAFRNQTKTLKAILYTSSSLLVLLLMAIKLVTFIKKNFDSLEVGVYNIANNLFDFINSYYNLNEYFYDANIVYESLVLYAGLMAFITLAFFIGKLFGKQFFIIILPLSPVVFLMAVGLTPKFIYLALIAMLFYVALNKKHSLVGFGVFAVILLVGGFIFTGPSNSIAAKGYKFKEFQEEVLEKLPFGKNNGNQDISQSTKVTAKSPKYKGTKLFEVTLYADEIKSSYYLKTTMGNVYKKGEWIIDDSSYKEFCEENSLNENYFAKKYSRSLYNTLYDKLVYANMKIEYLSAGYIDAVIPYYSSVHPDYDSKYDYIVTKDKNDTVFSMSSLLGNVLSNEEINFLSNVTPLYEYEWDNPYNPIEDEASTDSNFYIKHEDEAMYSDSDETFYYEDGVIYPDDSDVIIIPDDNPPEPDIERPIVFENYYGPYHSYSRYVKANYVSPSNNKFAVEIANNIRADHLYTLADVNTTEYKLEMCKRLANYFDMFYEYSLDVKKAPGQQDYMEYFLGTSRKGYCVHFATAAVFVLRELGIPARYASGYIVPSGSFEYVDDSFKTVVEDYNGHAWAEIYIDNLGWIPMEFTPGYGASGTPDFNHLMTKDPNNKPTATGAITPTKEPTKPVTKTPTPTKAPQSTKTPTPVISRKPKPSSSISPTAVITQAADSSSGATFGKIMKVILIIVISGGIVLVTFWLARRRYMATYVYAEKALAEKRYNSVIKKINRRIHRRAVFKNKGSVASDSEYLKCLKRVYPNLEARGLQGSELWDEYMRIVSYQAFSGSKCSKEEADLVYDIYKAIRARKGKN